MVKVLPVETRKQLKQFVELPWQIYRSDPNWVPPLKSDMYSKLNAARNPLLQCGPHQLFLAVAKDKPVGRIMVGINQKLNRRKGKNEGYFSLFESAADRQVSVALFDSACQWLRNHGMTRVIGPVSPTNGDDYRGLLVNGFEGPPVLMNSYNPAYYPHYFEDYGFCKEMDLYAYYFDTARLPLQRFERVVSYAMQKFNFRVDRFDMSNLDREVRDIKEILDRSMPESWEHLAPPSLEEVRAEVSNLKKFADPDLLYIARTGSKPIGFVVALPDYNQVLKKLNGRLFPTGFLKFLWCRRRITGVRVFVQFVVPEFRNKGVNGAIFYRLMLASQQKGYHYGEGSTIGENNLESRRSVEKAGGRLYRVYRIYYRDLQHR